MRASFAGDLAYTVYTSGSTGTPKGISQSHRGVVNYLTFSNSAYHLNPRDTALQVTTFSFDASIRDIFGPLSVGAKVVLVQNVEARDPVALLAKIREQQVTCILSIVPTFLDSLVEVAIDEEHAYESLRLILVSGEVFPASTWHAARKAFGSNVLLVNQYGPTECTMTSTYYPIRENPGNVVSIGRPIANCQIYLLDAALNPSPIGVPGEAYISNVGLAFGYVNHPDMTAAHFIPNPFGNQAGARMYKTGDWARYLPDGNLEFLGRMDTQVKIRGFRIELGEIEARLNQHPAVKKGIVILQENADVREKWLIAYVIPHRGTHVTIRELRRFMSENLPEYMTPTGVMLLDDFPLTPNGKIDVRALPRFTADHPILDNAFVAPRTPTEEILANLWADLLRVTRVGIYDNFFELGGHSLLATQVFSRIRHIFYVNIPLRALFETPTVAALAEHVVAAQWAEANFSTPVGALSSYFEEGSI